MWVDIEVRELACEPPEERREDDPEEEAGMGVASVTDAARSARTTVLAIMLLR